MQRDVLLLGEMIDAAEQIQVLVKGATVKQLVDDRQRRDAAVMELHRARRGCSSAFE